jgi:hypothetical protein
MKDFNFSLEFCLCLEEAEKDRIYPGFWLPVLWMWHGPNFKPRSMTSTFNTEF